MVEAGVVPDLLNAQLANVGRRLEPIPRDPDVDDHRRDDRRGQRRRAGRCDMARSATRSSGCGSSSPAASASTSDTSPGRLPSGSRPGTIERIVRKLQVLYRRGPDRLHRGPLGRPARPRRLRPGPGGGRVRHPPGPAGRRLGRDAGPGDPGHAPHRPASRRPGRRPAPIPAALAGGGLRPGAAGLAVDPSSCDLLDRRSLRLARDADRALPRCDRRRGRVGAGGGIRGADSLRAAEQVRHGDREGRPHGMARPGRRRRSPSGRTAIACSAGGGRSRAG